MAEKTYQEGNLVRIATFAVGILLALTSALLLFFDVIESGWATVVAIVGIGLIATSSRTGSTRQ